MAIERNHACGSHESSSSKPLELQERLSRYPVLEVEKRVRSVVLRGNQSDWCSQGSGTWLSNLDRILCQDIYRWSLFPFKIQDVSCKERTELCVNGISILYSSYNSRGLLKHADVIPNPILLALSNALCYPSDVPNFLEHMLAYIRTHALKTRMFGLPAPSASPMHKPPHA